MTVKELIEVLNEKNPDAVVYIGIEGDTTYPTSEVIDVSDWMQVPTDDIIIVGR